MSGMITTGDTNISTYGGRTIAIEVTGVRRQDVSRTSSYTVRVPYSRMSQTIQNINRLGGRVAGVSLGGNASGATVTPDVSDASTEEQSQKRDRSRKNRNRK